MRSLSIATLMIAAVAVGCSSTHRAPPTAASAAAVLPHPEHQSESAPPSSSGAVKFAHRATLRTSFSPSAAAHKVSDMFKEMNFSGRDHQWPPIPETEDHFYARARAVTADGHSIVVECKWVADGFTDVFYSSDLDDAQDAYMFEQIRDVLGSTGEDTK
jgi:hypothetical protein